MNKLKDLFYDKNDILVALAIVLIAGFVIYDRIDTIMDYPSMLTAAAAIQSEEQGNPSEPANPGDSEEPTDIDSEPEQETPSDADQDAEPDSEGDAVADQTAGEPTVRQVSIYIEYGATGSEIAQLLVDARLLENKEAFYSAVSAAGADTRLQAGSFKIPSDSTPDEIIRIITN